MKLKSILQIVPRSSHANCVVLDDDLPMYQRTVVKLSEIHKKSNLWDKHVTSITPDYPEGIVFRVESHPGQS